MSPDCKWQYQNDSILRSARPKQKFRSEPALLVFQLPPLYFLSSGDVDQLAGDFALRIGNRMRTVVPALALLFAFAITPGLAFRVHPPDVRFRLDGDGTDEGDERFEGHVSFLRVR